MNIAIISPHTCQNGNTTIASLVAYSLAYKNNKVCISHSETYSDAFMKYFGVEVMIEEKSKSLQFMNLIQSGGLCKEDISDYCYSLSDKLELFTLNIKDLKRDEFFDFNKYISTISFISTNFPHDYVIFDVDDNCLESPVNREILSHADLVIYVLTQSSTELHKFSDEKKTYFKAVGSIPCLVIVNKFCNMIGDIDDTAKELGIRKPKKWYKVRYNPWIMYAHNNGVLPMLMKRMNERDYRVLDIDSDIQQVVSGILSVKRAKTQIQIDKRKAR
ncbi:hypothetical protein acsn021_06550 [Anaerocolumna cellulosilytica]|uniref:Uncharacterized protein n=1 Tax=Anaerocolumna cellulosilytica TaxID=433286 RepID=A0A6S6QTT3_9FIRM|nr:hypothetical protein [Anaerocolumna cellulosilytica]MBB5197690.1 hypothetical protein [Anaerocolumna cellulosilytica]BCJ93086.1 hypothetical protein acsn021_06550 [Anaerocolumna cellulosilytica]